MTDVTPRVGVLVCSSDSRKDILDRVLPSLLKFWPDCPYPIYVGLNSHCSLSLNIKTLVSSRSEWRIECFHQVAQLAETHLIVVLDDFLIRKPVDQKSVAALVLGAISSDIEYLRLLPLGKSIIERVTDVIQSPSTAMVRAISERRPFYSGLQIAIWNRAHFMSLLKLDGSIWEFEHRRVPGSPHYAITGAPPIAYTHLVEKGRWLPHAASLLSRAGLPTDLGARPIWPRYKKLGLILDTMRFHVIGYANH